MSADILIYVSLGASALALALGLYAAIVAGKSRAWKKFFGNKNTGPENLQDMIDQIVEKIQEIDSHGLATAKSLQAVAEQLETATQNVGMVRYNGNGDDGGNLSFSAALLDAHQSGIILTSLHGRQQNRIYAKTVINGKSESTLSEEEKDALIHALTKNHN